MGPKNFPGTGSGGRRLLRQENPLNTWHQCQVWVNGEQIKNQHASGFYWVPQDLQPEEERCENSCMDHLEHYGLEKEKVWSFRRVFCCWDKAPETISSLTVKLMAETLERSGTPFPMPTVGQQIPVEHPLTKQPHLLTVLDIQKETITIPENMAAYEMPSQATRMHYRMEPNLDWTEFYLTDCQPQDQARRKDGTPYNGGSIGMMLRIPRDGTHMAVSSMRFSAPEEVLWQPVARWKRDRDIVINLM